ncbi:O-antigen ligase family protein [Staphylococcus pseudintermedius]|uniref:O-antigen ligase family protein n=1 Tax=Staphylococcus pseudintermedius TaxID=283734 RepID=UPI0009BEAA6A|nr:O-antigen ligase family protein [Staphylococcus pseudintermedius]EGQ1662079.1 O-antigen ligase domain-containing protein [Staphylococcus pseudintermedius]EGQ2815649.1 O-antigen ligase family protein [Staphylococcus pseudintermedius]EGQ3547434.1 O-antigen ligase family protein [Staphylococcus pseudintermedius]EGQ3824002.1 O-antigen ligase family protein [Staphylococcus pseudintermedius]EGQ4157974.1 O-antigen ligase family protein [Staphylococcus pseudintermedius]
MNANSIENYFIFKVSTIVIFTLYCLTLLGSLNATVSSFTIVGLIALFFVFGITNIGLVVYLFKGAKLTKIQSTILFLTLLLAIICVFSILNNGYNIKDLINSAQMIACLNTILYLSLINIDYNDLKFINILVIVFMICHFLIYILLGAPHLFSSIYNNSNLIGPYMFYTSFFLVCGMKFSKYKFFYFVMLVIGLILILASDTRSILLSVIATFLIYIFWHFIVKFRIVSGMFFLILVITSLLFVYIYPLLPTFQFYLPLENWVLTHTGKSIMSGRNELWMLLIKYIDQKPLLGYGPGTLAQELYLHSQSPHNLYLNILMQIGYLGLILILIIFLLMWLSMTRCKNHFIVRLSASFFVGIIVHQSFETTLFQNQLSVGLMQVFIIGIGFSIAAHKK